MIQLLRFVGLFNAAIWFGGNIAILFVAFTGFFSPEMKKLLQHEYFPGAVAQVIFSRFFVLQCLCMGIAAVHMLAEAFYFGRRVTRARLALLTAMSALIIFGGIVVTPKLKQLHQTKYFGKPQQLRADADHQLRKWHSAEQLANLLVMVGTGIYFWSLVERMDSPRFSRVTKFRG